jgi:hypothetical protein
VSVPRHNSFLGQSQITFSDENSVIDKHQCQVIVMDIARGNFSSFPKIYPASQGIADCKILYLEEKKERH